MSNPSSTAGGYQVPAVRYVQTPGVQNPEYLNHSGARDSHNTSRLSHLSHDSQASTINLGGHNYNVGTRVGKSFIIGDPHANDPSQTFDDLNVSKSVISTNTTGSHRHPVPKDKYPVLEKAYDFEQWNWPVVRLLCFLMVVFTMLALLAAVIGFIILGKTKCTSPFNWWQGSFTYHISVPHFSDLDDTNKEFGDLAGLQDKIAYFDNYLGVQTIVLSNFLPAQKEDNRWDLVHNFWQIDERLGTVKEFISLVEELHDRGIKVLMEFDIAYTGKSHTWFQDSRRHRPAYDSKFNQFYFWSENNPSGNNGSYTQDESRLEYYRYLYDKEKPMLNWNTPQVQDAFLEDLKTWLRRGVDGFVLKGLHHVQTDSPSTKPAMIKGWRTLLDQFSSEELDRKVLSVDKEAIDTLHTTEQKTLNDILNHLDLLEVPFSVKFDNLTYRLQGDVEEGLRYQKLAGGPWTSWKLSNIGTVEVGYRTVTMLYLLMLPGNPGLVAGQEVGRNVLEERDPSPLLWRLESVFPYAPKSPLNESTIAILQSVSRLRPTAYSLREDGLIEDGSEDEEEKMDADATKVMSHSFPYIDKQSLILKRRFRRRDAFYFAGNFGKSTIERDWYGVIAGGDIIADSHKKMSGSLSLAGDITLQRGQGIVFKVQY